MSPNTISFGYKLELRRNDSEVALCLLEELEGDAIILAASSMQLTNATMDAAEVLLIPYTDTNFAQVPALVIEKGLELIKSNKGA